MTFFGDQLFFLDWWNSHNFGEYWRKWNLPVHNFCVRHIYLPLLSLKIPKTGCMLIVFLISAIVHEYLLVFSFNVPFNGIVVLAFMIQTPLLRIRFRHQWLGNALFWILFCCTGQTFALQHLYYIFLKSNGNIKEWKSIHEMQEIVFFKNMLSNLDL